MTRRGLFSTIAACLGVGVAPKREAPVPTGYSGAWTCNVDAPPIRYLALQDLIETHTGRRGRFVRRGVGHYGTTDNWMLNFGGDDDCSCYWLLTYGKH